MTILMLLGGWFVLSVVVGCWFGLMVRTADAADRRTLYLHAVAGAPTRRPVEAKLSSTLT